MRWIILAICITCYGCAPLPTQQLVSRMPFPEQEYQALPTSGNAIVKGQAFLKTRGGDVKTAAGNAVILNPVTSYSKEWYAKEYLGGVPLEPPDHRLWNYVKKQVADASGRFTFKSVPAGDYFVTTVVTWEAPTGYGGGLQIQGGSVTRRITVKDGDELDVIVTR